MRYENGRVPTHLLVRRPAAGKSFCLMMPGTAVKHDRLVKLAQERYGWTPIVSGPDDAYRTYAVQEHYYRIFPPGIAAWPGTSSHGGEYEGVESGAVDYGNWADIGRQRWFELARDAGFEPGFFDGQYGRPVEPWHVIDWSPWHVPEKKPAPIIEEIEDDDMNARQIHYKDGTRVVRALFVPGTSYFVKWSEAGTVYANALAKNMETNNSSEVTRSLFGVFEREAQALRPKDALSIELAIVE